MPTVVQSRTKFVVAMRSGVNWGSTRVNMVRSTLPYLGKNFPPSATKSSVIRAEMFIFLPSLTIENLIRFFGTAIST